jgi:hypothetical protein
MLVTLAFLAPTVALTGTTAQPALADEQGAAITAVERLLTGSAGFTPDFNGVLFDTTPGAGDCTGGNNGNSNCWWWSANTWTALIAFAEENPNLVDGYNSPPPPASPVTYKSEIESDLWNGTYAGICGSPSQCPTSANLRGSDPFTVNTKGNTWFDDIGWWTQAWIDAYELVGRPYYLDLAEQLWDYVTYNGYKVITFPDGSKCNDGHGGTTVGVVQAQSGSTIEPPDAFANALYLRNSASLYVITHSLGDNFADQYMNGITYNTNSYTYGGAINAAGWIRSNLIFEYSGTLGTNATFMIADHVDHDSSCSPAGSQWELHGQGEMVNAWENMSIACGLSSTSGCNSKASYYNNLSDELADSIVGDAYPSIAAAQNAGLFYPSDPTPYSTNNPPSQVTPTVETTSTDAIGVLTDPCATGTGWPDGCNLSNPEPPWLISKGIFELAAYCEASHFSDSQLQKFTSHNANLVAGLAHFGPLWDAGTGSNDPVNLATQTSVLDALNADPGGQGAISSTLMCAPPTS